MFRFEKIKEYLIERITNLGDNLKDFFVYSLKNSFPYKMFEEEEVSPSYYHLFDDLDLLKLLENKTNNLDIEEIFKVINFFIEKSKKDKNFSHRVSYLYFKIQFVQAFIPFIEDPRNHMEEYTIIKNNKDKLIKARQLGFPFVNYSIRLNRNLYILKGEGL